MDFFSGRVGTTAYRRQVDSNKTFIEKATSKLLENTTCCFEYIYGSSILKKRSFAAI